jgi:hypothetical protein
MNGTESGDGNGEKRTDEQATADGAGVRARVAGRWDAAEYDISNVDDWPELGSGTFTIEQLPTEGFSSSGETGVAGWVFDGDDVADRTTTVYYARDGVHVGLEGENESTRVSVEARLSPEQARQLGAALYQAGEELERWQAATETGADE